MTNERYRLLEKLGIPPTWNESAEGWHYCNEFDGLLSLGEMIQTDGSCICGFNKNKVKMLPNKKTCKCANCKSIYYPLKYQSHVACARCVPSRNCVHGISNFVDCLPCFKINPSPNMRVMPALKKTGVVRRER